MNWVFFNPVTYYQITTNEISKSPQVRSLKVQSMPHYITVHQIYYQKVSILRIAR